MMKEFKTVIKNFKAIFKLEQNSLVISLKSNKAKRMLLARYTQDTIPTKLINVINSPSELYDMIEEIGKDGLNISKENELIMLIQIGKSKKEFLLPLEEAELSAEDKLKCQIQELTDELTELKTSNQKASQKAQTEYKKEKAQMNEQIVKHKRQIEKWKKMYEKSESTVKALEFQIQSMKPKQPQCLFVPQTGIFGQPQAGLMGQPSINLIGQPSQPSFGQSSKQNNNQRAFPGNNIFGGVNRAQLFGN